MLKRRSICSLALGLLFSASRAWGFEPFAPPDPRIDAADRICTASDGTCSAFYATGPDKMKTNGKLLLQLKTTVKNGRINTSSDQEKNSHPALVTMFSVECMPYFDWQTATLYESWKAAGVPGQLVRILACPASNRQKNIRFSNLGWDMQTHVHEPASTEYPPLNKPFGIWSWLQHEGSELPDNTIIGMVDPDMVFVEETVRQTLQPLVKLMSTSKDPPALGADYKYTVAGMRYNNWTLAHHFNINNIEKLQSIGPPIFLTKKRWVQILPDYYRITKEIMQNDTLKELVHDGFSKAPWIAEMYGYTLATVGFHHETNKFSVAFSTSHADQPLLVHYCYTFTLCKQKFGKYFYRQVDLLDCALQPSMLEQLHPPSQEQVAEDSCKHCLSSTQSPDKCFESSAKQWSFYAWQQVDKTVQSWRETHCPGF